MPRQRAPMKLKFADLLWLYILSHHHPAPSRKKMVVLFNEFLEENNVSSVYTLPIKGFSKVSEIVGHLRHLYYIAPTGQMSIKERGDLVWKHVGNDWKKFPLAVPIENHEPVWEKAIYF